MPERRYAVLLKEAAEVDIPKYAEILVKVKGIAFPEATKMVRDSGGLIYENLSEEEAEYLNSAFKTEGIETFTLPMEELVRVLPPIMVNSGKITDDYLYLYEPRQTKNGIKKQEHKIEWDKIILFACGRVRDERETEKMEFTEEILYAGARHLRTPTIEFKRVRKSIYEDFLDIFADNPERHFRIEASSFKYASVGLKIRMGVRKNFIALIYQLVKYSKNAFVDSSIKSVLDGDPATNLKISGRNGYNNYLLWILQLAIQSNKVGKGTL